MKLNSGQAIGIAIVTISLGLIAFQATRSNSSVTFYTPAEVYASPEKFMGKTFRVSGLVIGGSKTWDAVNHDLTFRMTDLENHDFAVHYKGIPPDLFKEGQGVIVEGSLAHGSVLSTTSTTIPFLEANLLMVKHSEVYDTKEDHSKIKEARLLDSMNR